MPEFLEPTFTAISDFLEKIGIWGFVSILYFSGFSIGRFFPLRTIFFWVGLFDLIFLLWSVGGWGVYITILIFPIPYIIGYLLGCIFKIWVEREKQTSLLEI